MSIKYAAWPTLQLRFHSEALVGWDQGMWDTLSECFRPRGYTGGIHDHVAYMRWSAERAIDAADEYEHDVLSNKASASPIATQADIERHIRVADQCRCGDCFCCMVKCVVGERKESAKQ